MRQIEISSMLVPKEMQPDSIKMIAYGLMREIPGTDSYNYAAFRVAMSLNSAQREVLKQLVQKGPVEDGDIASKVARDDLIELGLAGRVICKGEQGYTAANYIGWNVLKAYRPLPKTE
jgi:hypothetical protein